jgi:phosphoglycerol transferase
VQLKPKIFGAVVRDNFPFLAALAIFVALLFRNSGLYPVVADEALYSNFSRLLPLADSQIPGYIYLAIYRLTNICGDGFYDCARILNAIFFVAAAPFIYLTARQVCTRSVASIVVLLALLGPINSYTAYFMPEAPYFFSFWLATWFILRLDNSTSLSSWCFAGILLGLSALIKPHALLIMPGLVTYILFVSRKKEGAWVLQALCNVGVFIAFTFVFKFLISYLFVGKAGLTIFGPMYTSIATTPDISNFQRYIELFTLSIESVRGHLLAICLMFGMPVTFGIYAFVNSVVSKSEVKAYQKISGFAFVVLGNLILMTSVFSASVASFSVSIVEEIARLHMRYYDFALPLLLVIATSQLTSESTATIRKWRAVLAFPIGASILYAAYTYLSPFSPNSVDSPEIRGFISNPKVFYLLSGLSFSCLALWVYAARAGANAFVYLFMPLAVAFSTFNINREVRWALVPDVYDKAAIFAKQYLSQEDRSKLVIVGSLPGSLYLSLAFLDNPNIAREPIPTGAAYDLSKLPPDKEWVLVIGDHALPENAVCQLRANGFTLAHVNGRNTVAFKQPVWPCVISRTQGMSFTEPWGTWSSSDVVTLEFSGPLPQHFKLHLFARTMDTLAGKVFSAQVGDNTVRFVLSGSNEEKVLEFNNPERSKIIRFDMPPSALPEEQTQGGNKRRLGIGFVELQVEPL